MRERSRRALEECVRRKVDAKARGHGIPADDHRLGWVRVEVLELQHGGMSIDVAIATAWALAFPASLPHPRRGTHWQRHIRRHPGAPLIYGKPER